MNRFQKLSFHLILGRLANSPMEKLPAILDLAEKMDRGHLQGPQIRLMRSVLPDKSSVWYGFAERLFEEVDPHCIAKLIECFFINATVDAGARNRAIEEKYDCNVPWAILMDPTSACNLRCVGCWSAQYGDKHRLDYETMDSVCRQGKELGIHFYIFSGGEPLVRKASSTSVPFVKAKK